MEIVGSSIKKLCLTFVYNLIVINTYLCHQQISMMYDVYSITSLNSDLSGQNTDIKI